MDKVIELRYGDGQLLLLRRKADGGQNLGMGNKDGRHEFLHVVAAGLFKKDPDFIVDAVLIPPGYFFALSLEEGEAALFVGRVPAPECLKPADHARDNESGELLRIFGAGFGVSGNVFHSLNQVWRIESEIKLGVYKYKMTILNRIKGAFIRTRNPFSQKGPHTNGQTNGPTNSISYEGATPKEPLPHESSESKIYKVNTNEIGKIQQGALIKATYRATPAKIVKFLIITEYKNLDDSDWTIEEIGKFIHLSDIELAPQTAEGGSRKAKRRTTKYRKNNKKTRRSRNRF